MGDIGGRLPRPRGLPLAWVMSGGVGFLAAAGAVASILLAYVGQVNTQELLRDKATLTVAGLVERVEAHLAAPRMMVEDLGSRMRRGELDPTDRSAMGLALDLARAAAPQIAGAAFVSADGTVIRFAPRDRNAPEQHWDDPETMRALIAASSREGAFWGEFFHVEGRGTSLLNLRLGVRDPQDRFLGMLVAAVAVDELSAFLADPESPWGREAFILYGTDRVLAHPALTRRVTGLSDADPLPHLSQVEDPVLAALFAPDTEESEADFAFNGGRARFADLGEEEHMALYRALPGYGALPILVGVRLDLAEAAQPLDRLALVFPVAGGVAVLGLLAGLWLTRRITAHLMGMVGLARKIESLEVRPDDRLPWSFMREVNIAIDAANRVVGMLVWVQTYLPRGLVLRLMRDWGDDGPLSQERDMTVLFTDIEGFTELVEAMTPIEVQRLLNAHFDLLVTAVEAEGGTVDKFIGDGMMAFWGAPDDQPDHAERGLRAVAAAMRALEEDNALRAARGDVAVRLRLGLHSGPAIVGNIGARDRVNYTIVGDTVNVAQRFEQLGRSYRDWPGASASVAVIGASTLSRVGPECTQGLSVAPIGHVETRGRQTLVEACLAVSVAQG